MPKMISLHDVLEPLKQALLASLDVIISSQICVSKLQRVFTLGDGCWLPMVSCSRGSDVSPDCSGSSFWSDQVLLSKSFRSGPWSTQEILSKEFWTSGSTVLDCLRILKLVSLCLGTPRIRYHSMMSAKLLSSGDSGLLSRLQDVGLVPSNVSCPPPAHQTRKTLRKRFCTQTLHKDLYILRGRNSVRTCREEYLQGPPAKKCSGCLIGARHNVDTPLSC